MAGQTRPPSTSKMKAKGTYPRSNVDRLSELAQGSQKISSFAMLKMRSKSAKLFEEESLDTKKEAKREAWAPKSKQNLSSSSSKFQRHGKVEAIAECGMGSTKPRRIKEFGRVIIHINIATCARLFLLVKAEDHIFLADLVKLKDIFEVSLFTKGMSYADAGCVC